MADWIGGFVVTAGPEEIEIAKRIEEGQEEIIEAVLSSPLAVKEIVRFRDRLKLKKQGINLFRDPEEDYFHQEELNLPQILSLIERIRKQDERYREAQTNLGKKNLSPSSRQQQEKRSIQDP